MVNLVIWGICGNLFKPLKTLRTLRKTLRTLRLKKKKIAKLHRVTQTMKYYCVYSPIFLFFFVIQKDRRKKLKIKTQLK
jgi:hypothetical protein